MKRRRHLTDSSSTIWARESARRTHGPRYTTRITSSSGSGSPELIASLGQRLARRLSRRLAGGCSRLQQQPAYGSAGLGRERLADDIAASRVLRALSPAAPESPGPSADRW